MSSAALSVARKRVKISLFVAASLGILGNTPSSQAQISLTGTYSENFDSIGATATAALPASWKMSPAGTAAPTYAAAGNFTAVLQQASSGSPATGSRYNWGNGTTTTDRAIGFLTSGGYASPNSIMVQFSNDGIQSLTGFSLSYDIERYRINTAAASVQFFTSTDGSSWTAQAVGDLAASNFPTGTSSYTFATPGVASIVSQAVSGLAIGVGQSLYLRWNINTTGANSQGLGLDNFTIVPTYGVAVTPKNITWALASGGNWDTATANWSGEATVFTNNDLVTFDNIAGGTIDLVGTLTPGSITASAASGTYTFTGATATDKLSGSATLNKTGAGTLVFATDNSLAGATNLSAGTIQLNTASALGTSAISISNNATLKSGTAAAATFANSVTVTTGGGIIDTGSQNLTLSNVAGIASLLTKVGSGNLTITNIISPGAAGGLQVDAGNLILNQASGSVNLNVASSLTGNLVLVGPIRLGVNTTLSGTGQVQVAASGTLISNNTSLTSTLSAPTSLNSTSIAFVDGTWTGSAYTLGSFTTTFGAGTGSTFNVGPISGNSEVDFSANSGGGGGNGIVNLTGANTYTGATTINGAAGASVNLGVNNALPNTGLIVGTKTAVTTPTLNLNGFNQAVAYIADAVNINSAAKFLTITNAGATDSTLTIGSAITPGTSKFSGVISNGPTNKINVVKTGSNTQSLSGVSTYTGTTTVSQGTLALAQGGQLGATDVSVAGGATLATTYTAAGPIAGGNSLSLASGAALNLGDGTANTLSFTGGASALSGGALTFDFLSSSSFDILALGSTTLSGTNTIAFNGTPAFAVGTYSLITGTFNTGSFFTGPTSLGGFNLAYNNSGTALELVVSTPGGGGAPVIVATGSGAFGNLLLGSTATKNITLSNSTGTAATTGLAATGTGTGVTFAAPLSTTLTTSGAGATTTAAVTIDTSTAGAKTGSATYTAQPGDVISTPAIPITANVGSTTYGTAITGLTPLNYVTPAIGLTSTVTGVSADGTPVALNSTVKLLYYTNSTAGDTGAVSITMRTRTAGEASSAETLQTTGAPNLGGKAVGYLISDVANVTGMVDNGLTQTDVFVLQMSYSQALLSGFEADGALNGNIFLATLSNGNWVNAVDLNVGAGNTPTYAGNRAFALGDQNTLGLWGVDTTNDVVWAVLNHNSEFAVIPEPSTMVLGGIAMLGFAGLGLRRRRMKSV